VRHVFLPAGSVGSLLGAQQLQSQRRGGLAERLRHARRRVFLAVLAEDDVFSAEELGRERSLESLRDGPQLASVASGSSDVVNVPSLFFRSLQKPSADERTMREREREKSSLLLASLEVFYQHGRHSLHWFRELAIGQSRARRPRAVWRSLRAKRSLVAG